MRAAVSRLSLERAVQAAIVAAIFFAVLATGAILEWVGPARKLRWAALLVLAALAMVYAARRRVGPTPVFLPAAAALLVALALVSAAWSTEPLLTVARSGSLAVLFVAGGALAHAAAGRPESVRRLLDGVLAAAAVVAVGGLLVLAAVPDRAVQSATIQEGARYQGIGGNPNSAMMVLALGMPLAGAALLDRERPRRRVAAACALVLFAGSVVASGSRGALAAGFLGLLVVVALAPLRRRARVFAVLGVVAAFVVSAAITQLPQPDPSATTPVASEIQGPPPRSGYLNADHVRQLEDDIGHPGVGSSAGGERRALFGTSGRAQAWQGALGQAAGRPLLGYGFGTEDRVFVDRFVAFGSDFPENSYIGLVLQLGIVGLVLLLGLLLVVLARAGRALRRLDGEEARELAAAAGAVVAGLALGISQSYVTAVGSVAAGAVWLCVFLLAAAAAPRLADPSA